MGGQPGGPTKKRELRPVDGRKAAKKKRSQEDEQAGFQRQFLAQLEARTQLDNMKLLFAMYSESSCPVNDTLTTKIKNFLSASPLVPGVGFAETGRL